MPDKTRNEQAERDDAELAGLAGNGDEAAFRKLLEKYRNKILAICLRMLKDITEAEEAAQDSWVKIYFHLKSFDKERSFVVWAGAIAMNDCRDRLRKRSRNKKYFREIDERDGAYEMAIESNCETGDSNLKSVEQALEALPGKLKEIIVLKAYGEYSYEDIAKILGVRIGTVMSRLFRARKKLTEILKKAK